MRMRERSVRRAAILFAAAMLGAPGCGRKSGDDAKPKPDAGESPAEVGTYLHVVVPSVIEKDALVPVRLRVLTQVGLPDYDFEGTFRIDTSSGEARFPKEPLIEPQPEGFYQMNGLAFGETGVQRLRASVPQDTVMALANPFVVVERSEWSIFWGDLNAHSDLSLGARAPAIAVWYARNVALLDFVALTDSERDEKTGKNLDEKAVLEFMPELEKANEKNRFVTLPGFEWTSAEHGNRIVLYDAPPASLPTHTSGIDTPAKLRTAVPAGALVMLPHPSGSVESPAAPPASVAPGREELVEIYSAVGSFEVGGSPRASSKETPGSFVTDLLAKGCRPGFIATSDSKLTTPGNPRGFAGGDGRWSAGLTAVLAKELTRESVLEALRARRSYATTGQRYLLEFTVDGSQMGSELRVKKGHRAKVYGSLGSTTKWIRAEIVGPQGAMKTLAPEGEDRDVIEIEAETPAVTSPTWLYLRGVDEQGGMVWSSPVYLVPE